MSGARVAYAQNAHMIVPMQGYKQSVCPDQNVNVCGQSIRVDAGFFGEWRHVRLPPQFEVRDITLQCAGNTSSPSYFVTNPINAPCSLRQCGARSVSLCDDEIPINNALRFGQELKVPVPSALLVPSKRGMARSFSVQCGIQGEDVTLSVANTSSISCNDFPCKPVVLSLCGGSTKVQMNDTAELGQVFRIATNLGQPVTVSCLGSNAYRPVYQITDASQVTCP